MLFRRCRREWRKAKSTHIKAPFVGEMVLTDQMRWTLIAVLLTGFVGCFAVDFRAVADCLCVCSMIWWIRSNCCFVNPSLLPWLPLYANEAHNENKCTRLSVGWRRANYDSCARTRQNNVRGKHKSTTNEICFEKYSRAPKSNVFAELYLRTSHSAQRDASFEYG